MQECLNSSAVSTSEKKPIIGILGGIGSGKSSVASQFAKLGCGLIDADKIAHELLDKQNVQQQVVSVFGNRLSKLFRVRSIVFL